MKQQLFKNPFLWVIALLLLGGAGYGTVRSGMVDLSRFQSNAIFQSNVPPEGLLAQVNGEGIQKVLFERRFEQTKNSYVARGATLEEKDTEIVRQQMLDNMINELLLLQYARKQGITVQDQLIEDEYQQVVAQFPSEEEFQKHLATQEATSEDVRSVIFVQLAVQQIIDLKVSEHPIEISEEEMRQVYDRAVENGAEVPPFEEVTLDIENQLRQQKIGQLMDALIQQLHSESAIEIFG